MNIDDITNAAREMYEALILIGQETGLSIVKFEMGPNEWTLELIVKSDIYQRITIGGLTRQLRDST